MCMHDNEEEGNSDGLEYNGDLLTVHLWARWFWYVIWNLSAIVASYTFSDIIKSYM